MHKTVYNDQKLWGILYHLQCWERAGSAFDHGSFADFEWLYNELKGHWQVFRNAQPTPWSAKKTFDHLCELGDLCRCMTLRDVTDTDMPRCWQVLQSLADIKPLKYGPSVVAISKFLHFWNPRLFVIVDDAVVWKWVFAHSWLREPMLQTRRHLATIIDGDTEKASNRACDLLSYLAILRWSAEVIQCNPAITEHFAVYVRSYANEIPIGIPLESYDAAAIEWLLLGIVEIPPAGVSELCTE